MCCTGLRLFVLVFLVGCFGGCGRTELDLGSAGTIPVTTGASGAGVDTGSGGSGLSGAAGVGSGQGGSGANEGLGGSSVTGVGGFFGTAGVSGGGQSGLAGIGGEAGAFGTGAAGSSEGGTVGTGAAGSSEGGTVGTGAAGSSEGGSSGAAGSSDAGAGGLPLNTVCDPVAQNCAPGLRCDLPDSGALAFICMMDNGGSGGQGAMCQESSQDCEKGATCIQPVNRRGQPTAPATCFVICNSSADCPTGTTCTNAGLFNDGGNQVEAGICQSGPAMPMRPTLPPIGIP